MLLRTLARAYAGIAALRRGGYERGLLPSAQLPVPVVSVGALRLGGSGKTPVAGYLAGQLGGRGHKVGIVLRGYGGRARRVMRVGPEDCGLDVGDEAVLHARWLPEAIVVRGADKRQAARLAIAAGAEVIVLDDGFQHLQLQRDLDLVISDAALVPPLPLGAAREGRSALRRADVTWLHGRDGELPRAGGDVASRMAVVSLVGSSFESCAPASTLAGARVVLLGAIARPQAFVRLVAAQGATIVGARFRRDHRPLGRRDLARARASGADVLLCTEKDLARQGRQLDGVVALRCRVCVERGAELLAGALERLMGARC